MLIKHISIENRWCRMPDSNWQVFRRLSLKQMRLPQFRQSDKIIEFESIEMSPVRDLNPQAEAVEFETTVYASSTNERKLWCAIKDLNLHVFRHSHLKAACLPFHQSHNKGRIYLQSGS